MRFRFDHFKPVQPRSLRMFIELAFILRRRRSSCVSDSLYHFNLKRNPNIYRNVNSRFSKKEETLLKSLIKHDIGYQFIIYPADTAILIF